VEVHKELVDQYKLLSLILPASVLAEFLLTLSRNQGI